MNICNKTGKSVSFFTAIFTALVVAAPAMAETDGGNATLASNERAARDVIVDSTFASAATHSDSYPSTLARNERAAQRAVLDVAENNGNAQSPTSDEPNLSRNEWAAQRAIADTRAPVAVVKTNGEGAALDPSSPTIESITAP